MEGTLSGVVVCRRLSEQESRVVMVMIWQFSSEMRMKTCVQSDPSFSSSLLTRDQHQRGHQGHQGQQGQQGQQNWDVDDFRQREKSCRRASCPTTTVTADCPTLSSLLPSPEEQLGDFTIVLLF